METQSALEKYVHKEASRAYWVGCAVGVVCGIAFGVMVGFDW